MDNTTVKIFTEIIREIVKEEVGKIDTVQPCEIVSFDSDTNLVNIRLISDPTMILKNIENCSKYSFKSGDIAYLFKIGNDLSNSFIIGKQKK